MPATFAPNIRNIPTHGIRGDITIVNALVYPRNRTINWVEIPCKTSTNATVILINAALFGHHWLPQPFLAAGLINPVVWGDFSFGPGYVGELYDTEWYIENVDLPIVYTLVSGALPPGLTLQNIGSTARGSISGTPTASGLYGFTLRATGPTAVDDQFFGIRIYGNPPGWGDFEFGPGFVNKAYETEWFIEDADQPVVYSLVAGALPSGLSLVNVGSTARGQISGTPTLQGDYAFTLRATGPDTSDDKDFTISIYAYAPVWGTFSFPNGYTKVVYMFDWFLENATLPCTFSLVSGALPPGLTLDTLPASTGIVHGTPTQLGTFNFTLRATNIIGTADKAFQIVVLAGPPPPTQGGTAYVGGN